MGLIFLKYFHSITFMEKMQLQKKINDLVLNSVKNIDIYNEEIKNYWVGFPKKEKNDTVSTDNANNEASDSSNTPLYDKESEETEGSVRFLDDDWIKQKKVLA